MTVGALSLPPPIAALDHLIVAVADLEAARRAWQCLGFTVTPRGRHIGWGTANYCIMFAHDYVELLGIVDASQFTNNLDRRLATRGEGILGLALATPDADATYAALRRLGIDASAPQSLGRLLELPEGAVEPRFRLVHLPAGTLPGAAAFVCQHLTPALVRRPAWLAHPNGGIGIAEVIVAVDDEAKARVAYDRLLVDPALVRLVERKSDETPGIRGFTIAVADLAACRECLAANGVSARPEADGTLRVAARLANGVDLAFRAAARDG